MIQSWDITVRQGTEEGGEKGKYLVRKVQGKEKKRKKAGKERAGKAVVAPN